MQQALEVTRRFPIQRRRRQGESPEALKVIGLVGIDADTVNLAGRSRLANIVSCLAQTKPATGSLVTSPAANAKTRSTPQATQVRLACLFPINWIWNPCPVVSGAEEVPIETTSPPIHPVPRRFMLTEVLNTSTDNNVKTDVKQGSGHLQWPWRVHSSQWITPPVVLPHPGTPFLSPQGATTGGAALELARRSVEHTPRF